MRLSLIIPLLLMSAAAQAQIPMPTAAPAPAPGTTTAPTPTFPDWAVTNVGKNPSAPPAAPSAGAPAPVPVAPQAPIAPTAPTTAAPDIWPADTVPVFLRSCARNRQELMAPCRCTIETLMKAMSAREFTQLSESGAVARDVRYVNARQSCASASSRR
ncbi:MAG: hypothetical protein ACK52W_00725 [Alphaproteobacteria bacterium]